MELDNHFWLSIMHLIVVVPLFLYVGITRAETPQWLYTFLLSVGIVILGYHGFKLIVRLRNNSTYSWVNAMHILLIAPLLIYIGYNKKQTPKFAYELLLMAAFAAGGYHLFSIIRQLNIHPDSI
jgi:hypothetical protein